MKVMKYLFFFLSALFFTSCADDNEQVNIDTAINVSVKDVDGNNLFNPNILNSLNQNEIKIFYEINKELVWQAYDT